MAKTAQKISSRMTARPNMARGLLLSRKRTSAKGPRRLRPVPFTGVSRASVLAFVMISPPYLYCALMRGSM